MRNTSFSSENPEINLSPENDLNNGDTMSIAVLSGKGGVGKTNLALNIARTLYKEGDPVLVMDCDLGLANLDVLLGLDTQYNLHDVIAGRVEAHDAIASIEGESFDFIPAASGQPELIQMDDDSLGLLFEQLAPSLADYRYLFLDLGAGISPTVLSFASLAHIRIIVISPEPTSITDGYAVMKVLNTRYGFTDFKILVNQVTSKQEFELAAQRLCGATEHFLGFSPGILGFVQQDKTVMDAVRQQVPFTRLNPDSPASRNVAEIAAKIKGLRAGLTEVIKQGPVLIR